MWTKEDQARVRTLHTKQMTVKEIAEKMGKPQEVVRAALEDMGYKPIESKPVPEASEFTGKRVEIPKKPYRKTTTADVTKILELKVQGISNRGIAARLGMSKSSVTYALAKYKEDKPMKAAQINEEFDKAVDEMIADAKEKEPAPSANDASPKEVTSNEDNHLSHLNDTTKEPESQAITAITGVSMIESMLHEWLGAEADITYLHAERQIGEIRFLHEGREYAFTFGEVPSYGNDKH